MSSQTIGRNTVASEHLRAFVERIESIRSQKKQLGLDEAEIIAEAKAQGFDAAGLRYCVKVRAMKPHQRQESEALADMYLHALGMASEPPLFRAVGLMTVDVTARDQVLDAMKQFVPAFGAGDITVNIGKPVRLSREKDGNVTITEIVEKPTQPDIPGTSPKQKKSKPDIPDVDGGGAEELGRKAFREDVPVIANPFPFGDARRPRWDLGWRRESGSDGMGPDDE